MSQERDGYREMRAAAPQPSAAAPARTAETGEDLLERAARQEWTLRRLERAYILHLLARHDGHRGRTAESLGIDRRTLYRKLKEYEAEDT